ncbi:ABC transporter substrate-binding protein [Geodermatophilus ruber]|uniref:Iron complex transport system substrate-binding protein n=1 Tax=Geodermatophilus ruber TaxID=504800 RepID=A0A1I4GD31_9ACTN|nr:ABC transporter substrate-binding protein [Geodermatophilus ruber]SFL27187.1 iron complex transport system substrate-binding protein [Geodermatophilus ruber]
MSRTRRLTPATLLLPLVLALAACSGDAPAAGGAATATTTSADGGAFPVTVTGDDGELTLEQRPEAIVSLSASATEMLFAIGAGDQVEAVDSTSNHPAEAPTTDLSAFTPNAEAIAAYSPDLVVLSDDMNGIVDALDALAVPTLLLGAADTLDDSYAQLETLGEATGHAEGAAEVITDMQERIDAAVASVPAEAQGMRVYHELDPSFFSTTSDTFVGSVYTLLGLENIADGAADAAGGYPQLSAEYVVGQAPGLIVLADTVCCQQTAETVAQRPAFDTVPAVQEGRVLEADDDIASRWGPRVADFAESVAAALQG